MSVEFGDVLPVLVKTAEVAIDGLAMAIKAARLTPEQRKALLAPLRARLDATADAVEAAPVFDPDAPTPPPAPTV
jgi:hypothetical protein